MIDVYKDWQTHHCPTKMGVGEPEDGRRYIEGKADCHKMKSDGEHPTKEGAKAITVTLGETAMVVEKEVELVAEAVELVAQAKL
eukprot:6825777-Prymnesium_polylepis.1